jgi:multidrug efflux pump subunit AcrA (membrane-fusion protein)
MVFALVGCSDRPRREEPSPEELASPVARSQHDGEAVVELDSGTIARIGLRTVALKRGSHRPELELTGVIVADAGAASVVRAGVSGRLSAVAERPWPRIGEHLTSGEPVAQVGDARPMVVPRGGTVTRLLAHPGELVQAGQTLFELMDYATAVARIAWPPDGPVPPREVAVSVVGAAHRLRGRLEGPSPEADPVTRGPAFLYRVHAGAAVLRPGVAVTAFIAGPAPDPPGVEIPADATVQWASLVWAYVERAPGRYVRVRVPTDQPVAGGWRVTGGFDPGDRVVVTGAGQLLSEEFRARIVVGEEVGE